MQEPHLSKALRKMELLSNLYAPEKLDLAREFVYENYR